MVVERNFQHREVKSSSKINSKFTFEVTTAMEICKQYPPFGAKSYSDICPGIFVLGYLSSDLNFQWDFMNEQICLFFHNNNKTTFLTWIDFWGKTLIALDTSVEIKKLGISLGEYQPGSGHTRSRDAFKLIATEWKYSMDYDSNVILLI